MRRLVLIGALVAALALEASVAVAATAPVASTGTATNLGQNHATLTATVDPKGTATSVRFDLGTATSYGLQSTAKDIGSGTGAVTVDIAVQGLTAGTIYHYRVVATSSAGTVRGADATFIIPTAPAVTTSTATAVTPSAATLTGRVNPRAGVTQYHFTYGPTTAYGTSTPTGSLAGTTSTSTVSARIAGLTPGRIYHYRLVATNAIGTTNGADRSFRAGTTPTAASLSVGVNPVTYGRTVVLSGRLSGSKTSGVPVLLQTTPFPFSARFVNVLMPVTTTASGTFSFTLPAVTITTRAVVIASGNPSVLSPIVVIRSAIRTGITSVHRVGRSVTIAGRLTPATPQGVAALQRQTTDGRWVPARRATIGPDGRYAITIRSRRQRMAVRVVGLPHDGGAHVRGTSRVVMIAGR